MVTRTLVALSLALFLAALPASAATVSVNPTRLVLAPGASSAVLTLRNDSSEDVRFQVTSFEWSNSLAGAMVLRPTDDVVAFPALMVIEPHGTRKIRIAVLRAAGAQELSYRLVVGQIPSRAGAEPSAGVNLLTQFSVPVFVQPKARRVTAVLDPIRFSPGRVQISFHDKGPVHLTPEKFELTALDGAGKIVWTKLLPAWYLLAGDDRELSVGMDARDCPVRLVASLRFQELTGALTEAALIPRGVCSR